MTRLASSLSDCAEHHCITCADDGVAMTVVRVDSERELALCEDDHAVRSTVQTALVLPVREGERLLVHAGVAIAALGNEQPAPAPEEPASAPATELLAR